MSPLNESAIHADGLSKRYRIGGAPAATTLREAIQNLVRRPLSARPPGAPLWAIRDVSFEVARGEVLGVIGRNGAGKSTLLRILAGITAPSEGRAQLRGRVGSLLEVGAGFHSELTGRDNVYLSGAILGMRRAELRARFDEIVAFAEMASFIDTPVKHYSSGMYLRLAFAVAAHLDTEILLVDEALAVGDLAFQRKCLGKMGEATRAGRTVVFVSHDMVAVERLCDRCLFLEGGRVVASGPAGEVINRYLGGTLASFATAEMAVRPHGFIRRARLAFHGRDGTPTSYLPLGGDVAVTIEYEASAPMAHPVFGVVVKNRHGVRVLNVNNRYLGEYPSAGAPAGRITCFLEACPFTVGPYTLDLWFGDPYRDYETLEDALAFEVVARDVFGTGVIPPPDTGVVVWPARWKFE
jgi:lipopolysaccharide transport system ATP-binding protein